MNKREDYIKTIFAGQICPRCRSNAEQNELVRLQPDGVLVFRCPITICRHITHIPTADLAIQARAGRPGESGGVTCR